MRCVNHNVLNVTRLPAASREFVLDKQRCCRCYALCGAFDGHERHVRARQLLAKAVAFAPKGQRQRTRLCKLGKQLWKPVLKICFA